jgi:hypothetical protein
LSSAFTLVSCSAYFLTLKMEAVCSSGSSVDFQWTARCYITEDSPLHNHPYENLKSYNHCFLAIIGYVAGTFLVSLWHSAGFMNQEPSPYKVLAGFQKTVTHFSCWIQFL